jgi:hypothetical protein
MIHRQLQHFYCSAANRGNSDSGAHLLERCRRMPKTKRQDSKTSKNEELRGLWVRRRRFRSCAAANRKAIRWLPPSGSAVDIRANLGSI